MSVFINGKTKKCCVCYAIATNWSGWLRKSRDGIVAGFCETHRQEPNTRNTYGSHNLHGIYNKNMEETTSKIKGEEVIKKYGLDKNLIEQ